MKNNTSSYKYVNPNTFMVEILGMTNVCNLRCEYCDWKKFRYIPLSSTELDNVRKNLNATRTFVKSHYPNAQMIEYSGGEPFAYPEIVHELLKVFPDYWVRVITNATLIKPESIKRLAEHGKAFLSISLDGPTVEANKSRRLTENQFNRILSNVDLALNSGVPVMLLCTLNEDNIDFFENYISFLENKWGSFIESGMLVLPAHILSSYDVKHRGASKKQEESFKKTIRNIKGLPVERIREHYDMLYATERQCTIYQWTASMHFLDREIATNGNFTTFRCGMRGVGKVGTFNVISEMENDTFSNAMAESMKTPFEDFKCGCTVDWNAMDLIFAGCISQKRAEEWFVVFKDSNIKAWLQEHKNAFNKAYTRKSNCIPCIADRTGKKE